MNRKKNTIVGLLLGMVAIGSYQPVNADNRAAQGLFFGGLTGAAIGGAAGGGKGAAIGGGIGALTGAMMGAASEDRYRDPYYDLNKLYKKRDSLERRLHKTNSERARDRLQRRLDQVNRDISWYEQRYDSSGG